MIRKQVCGIEYTQRYRSGHNELLATQLTRNVNDLVTRERAKARVFVDSLANASFFLNFG